MENGRLIPAAIVLSHPEQLDRLRESAPAAAEVAVLAGDPTLDRMLAGRPLRATYRRALGVETDQRLVVVSSTWGTSSLFGQQPKLVPRLAASLPLDGWRVVLALHPNIWAWHSPWQVRMWLDDCRRAGVRVLPPEQGWQAALVAADLVVGDHGSVTFYAAALDRPVLLASAPHDTVDPRSPIAQLLAAAPRLNPAGPPADQLEAALRQHDHESLRNITELGTSDPGDSARLLRAAIYRLLDLPEPPDPAETRAVPVPPAEPRSVTAQLVTAKLVSAPDDLQNAGAWFEVIRRPAELLRIDAAVPPESHLSVDTGEPYRRWLELADVIVLPAAADLGPTLALMPGCLLGTAPTDEPWTVDETQQDEPMDGARVAARRSAGGSGWIVRLRDGQQAHFRGVPFDGRICASLVHAWLDADRSLSELPGRLSVRLGGTRWWAVDVTVS